MTNWTNQQAFRYIADDGGDDDEDESPSFFGAPWVQIGIAVHTLLYLLPLCLSSSANSGNTIVDYVNEML